MEDGWREARAVVQPHDWQTCSNQSQQHLVFEVTQFDGAIASVGVLALTADLSGALSAAAEPSSDSALVVAVVELAVALKQRFLTLAAELSGAHEQVPP
jgi:hypothetical protein